MTGGSILVAGADLWVAALKYSGEVGRFVEGTSGLVGGEEAAVSAVSERSSSDFVDEAVGEAVLGTISGALYESIFVV